MTPFRRKQSNTNKYEIMSSELTIPPLVLLKSVKNGTPLSVPVKTVIATYPVLMRVQDYTAARAGTPVGENYIGSHYVEDGEVLKPNIILSVFSDGTMYLSGIADTGITNNMECFWQF